MIEDDFIAGRPAWEKVGVEFTKDVTAYENMKLSLLNASHQMLSYPAFLSGYRKVTMPCVTGVSAVTCASLWIRDITPYVPASPAIQFGRYKRTLIERFGNRSVSDQLARLLFRWRLQDSGVYDAELDPDDPGACGLDSCGLFYGGLSSLFEI